MRRRLPDVEPGHSLDVPVAFVKVVGRGRWDRAPETALSVNERTG
jgi:hypothetical protein